MKKRDFIFRVLLRDADMIDRGIEIFGFGFAAVSPFVGWGNFDTWPLSYRLLVSLAAVGVTLAIIFGRQAYRLANEAEPKIDLRFGPSDKFVTDTPYQAVVYGGSVPTAFPGTARYVRVEAINRGTATAENCSAYLLAVKRLGPNGELIDTEFNETMKLKWSMDDVGTIDLDSDIHRFFNVFSVRDREGRVRFEFATADPLRYLNLCSEPGTYRARVCVRGTNFARSETLAIEFDWTGSLETLSAKVSQWHAANT